MMTRANFGWWLYIALILGLGFGQMIHKISSDTGGMTSRFGPALAATILAAGVIAMLLQKPIFKQWFWKSVFCLLVTTSISALGLTLYLLFAQAQLSLSAILLLGSVILLLPGQIQIYRYAFGNGIAWTPVLQSHQSIQQSNL